jgi:hypothetical protein
MKGAAAISHTNDRAGLLYALAGFCTLSIGDAIIKGMAGEWPARRWRRRATSPEPLLLRSLLARSEGVAALRLPRDPLQWLRGVAISPVGGRHVPLPCG